MNYEQAVRELNDILKGTLPSGLRSRLGCLAHELCHAAFQEERAKANAEADYAINAELTQDWPQPRTMAEIYKLMHSMEPPPEQATPKRTVPDALVRSIVVEEVQSWDDELLVDNAIDSLHDKLCAYSDDAELKARAYNTGYRLCVDVDGNWVLIEEDELSCP